MFSKALPTVPEAVGLKVVPSVALKSWKEGGDGPCSAFTCGKFIKVVNPVT